MSLETETTIMIALIPFLAIWGLLRFAHAVERRRDARVARQIALTDAIHRELGAVAAPNVRRTWSGEWVVSMRLALARLLPADRPAGSAPPARGAAPAGAPAGPADPGDRFAPIRRPPQPRRLVKGE